MVWHGEILFDDYVMLSSHHTQPNSTQINTNQLHFPQQVCLSGDAMNNKLSNGSHVHNHVLVVVVLLLLLIS